MVLTKEQIANEFLEAVVKESKSGLYKEIEELVTAWFEQNDFNELLLTPIDIKKKWFDHNNRYEIAYIRRVLKQEMKLTTEGKAIRYTPFGNEESRTGRPFTFKRTDFDMIEVTEEDDEIPF